MRWMTWRALFISGARHVIGFRLTQETRVKNVCDDVASTIHASQSDGTMLKSVRRKSRNPSVMEVVAQERAHSHDWHP